MKFIKSYDLILIFAMLLPFLSVSFFRKKPDSLIIIRKNSTMEFSLDQDRIIPVSGEYPLTVEVKNCQARIICSTCPSGRCRHKTAVHSGDTLICAPNRTFVMIRGRESIDAFTE